MGSPYVSLRSGAWIFIECGDAQDDLSVSNPLSNEVCAAFAAKVT